ncbi:hypothetical protein QDR37_03520 [Amnibacterium sp. CER49]|uniref:hypothetical protein n=1 Tax=Amnibacterium sp. CER49 TaxID=3039161 RepID=UPI002447CAEF|nr:hypothetical protein [Amnibacterium sp. CER49]MDH2443009.1 hypothetical protein [Amnibacterium sp. CER49]
MPDRLIFGDNQFFGVNHMSEDKARAQAIRFQTDDAVLEVLEAANRNGIRSFMCTTHDRLGSIVPSVLQRPEAFPDQQFLPCMPYAHKYSNAMAEQGIIGSLQGFLPERGRIEALVRSGRSLASRDIAGVATLLIDAEMRPFRNASTPVVFLQNVTVDLILGLGAYEIFQVFADHVRTRYNAEPGFITMNVPRLLDALRMQEIENPLVCANVNKLGFRMSGGVEAYEEALRRADFRLIAMSIFASGAIPPAEAVRWVCGLPNIESIVFGASSERNIVSTRDLVETYWRRQPV